jgi:hypothetical protein
MLQEIIETVRLKKIQINKQIRVWCFVFAGQAFGIEMISALSLASLVHQLPGDC